VLMFEPPGGAPAAHTNMDRADSDAYPARMPDYSIAAVAAA
jgi:hypothetical protein